MTEFFKHRMVLPFTGSYAELEQLTTEVQAEPELLVEANAARAAAIVANVPSEIGDGAARDLRVDATGPAAPDAAQPAASLDTTISPSEAMSSPLRAQVPPGNEV